MRAGWRLLLRPASTPRDVTPPAPPALEQDIGGLRCGEVLAALSDYLDGDLSADARGRVEAHVAGCANCERFGGMFAEVVRRLRARAESAADAADDAAAFAHLRAALDEA